MGARIAKSVSYGYLGNMRRCKESCLLLDSQKGAACPSIGKQVDGLR